MKKQTGSVHVVVVIVLVLALITALGWIFWQNFVHKEPVKTVVETVVREDERKDSDNDNSDDLDLNSESKANKLVTDVYTNYIESRKSGSSVEESLKTVKSYFTNTAYASILSTNDLEGLTCAANYIPEYVKVNTEVDGSTATSLVVRHIYGQDAEAKITVTTDLTTMKINNVSCPQ